MRRRHGGEYRHTDVSVKTTSEKQWRGLRDESPIMTEFEATDSTLADFPPSPSDKVSGRENSFCPGE